MFFSLLLCFLCYQSYFQILTMAGISHLSQIFCQTCSLAAPQVQSGAKLPFFPANYVGMTGKAVRRVRVPAGEVSRVRPVVLARTALDDEWGPEKLEPAGTMAVVEEEEKPSEIDRLKKALVDSFYGTDRGLKASSETRAEIVELITQLEAKNPTPAPTEALSLLNGKWILA